MGTVGRTSSFYVIQKQVKEQKMKNRIKYLLGVLIISPICMYSKDFNVSSPDNKIILSVNVKDRISWSVNYNSTPVILPSFISLQTKEKTLGANPHIRKSKIHTVNETITTSIYKKRIIEDNYKELNLTFAGNYALQFRVYDDGVAYRWIGLQKEDITILSEGVEFNFAKKNSKVYVGYVNAKEEDVYSCSFENTYQHIPLEKMSDFWPAFTPILVEQDGIKCGITEADLEDYPGMFLRINKKTRQGLIADFAPYPVEEVQGGHNNLQSLVVKRADYTAKTKGDRTFPWRVVIIADEDKDLLNNDMVYKLASPCRINDTSWIKPGKLAWDYWNAWNIYGVDFRAGINTNTYLYYIDFAAKNGIEYVLLDEGWAESTDIMKVVPEIDLPYIIRYARLKGVSILLWGGWLHLSQKMNESLEHYAELGVKGVKVDFMDRDDQKMVNFYYRLAQKAAEHNLIIDFHGAYKPTGLQRTYPNVINFEGVYGLEYLKGDYPDMPFNDVTIPYIRMLAGPVDYTPGAMVNANKESYRGIHSIPMSQGTRAHQVALYVVFESPLNMLADSPNNYMKEQETTDFLRQIPTVFDQTVALDGKVGEYAVIAREKSDIWYLGAITNWETREITIDFSFLKEGNWQMELFRDGVNADRNGNDYKREVINVNINSKIKVSLAPGGGMAAIIRKINH